LAIVVFILSQMILPYVLDFRENEQGEFVATAAKPLQIENWALGYGIVLVLEEFIATSQTLIYLASLRFDELSPESEKQFEHWRKNRLRAYHGSLRHFLATLSDTTAPIHIRLKQAGQESWIKLEAGPVKFDSSGYYHNNLAIMEFGYWAWERLAETLP
jgi:hypothetical protein